MPSLSLGRFPPDPGPYIRRAEVGERPVSGWRLVRTAQRREGDREAALEHRALPADPGKGVAFGCFPQTVDKSYLAQALKILSHRDTDTVIP